MISSISGSSSMARTYFGEWWGRRSWLEHCQCNRWPCTIVSLGREEKSTSPCALAFKTRSSSSPAPPAASVWKPRSPLPGKAPASSSPPATKAKLREVADAHPEWRERFLVVPADVTKDEDVRRLVATTLAKFGRVDILVNNAGIGMRAPFADMPLDDVHSAHGGELSTGRSAASRPCCRRCGSSGAGQIVNVGSVLSMVVAARNSAYCASKFALLALSDTLRIELHGTGIEVISVLPAYTDTPFFDHMYRYGGPAP